MKSKLTTRKCKFCQEKFQQIQPLQYLCLPPKSCSWEYQKLLKENLFKKQCRDEKKEFYEKNKTVSQWKNDLQDQCNLIARLIDKEQPCIATGNYIGKMAGGHCIGVGANDTIRFNLHNIHIQSFHSNSWKGGDNLRYQAGIERIYGKYYLDSILSLQSISAIKLSVIELKEKMVIARQIIKELKHIDSRYSPCERILLRDKYNKQLGIYK